MTTQLRSLKPTPKTPQVRASLADIGSGRLAYVRPLRSEDVPSLFPQAPYMAPGLELFALLGADGTPIVLTDTKEAAMANAWQNGLDTVSVH